MTKADVNFPKDDEPHSVVLRRESITLVQITRHVPLEQLAQSGSNGQPAT
jgi:hypothetical protein